MPACYTLSNRNAESVTDDPSLSSGQLSYQGAQLERKHKGLVLKCIRQPAKSDGWKIYDFRQRAGYLRSCDVSR